MCCYENDEQTELLIQNCEERSLCYRKWKTVAATRFVVQIFFFFNKNKFTFQDVPKRRTVYEDFDNYFCTAC